MLRGDLSPRRGPFEPISARRGLRDRLPGTGTGGPARRASRRAGAARVAGPRTQVDGRSVWDMTRG